jgi:hypothetical protein
MAMRRAARQPQRRHRYRHLVRAHPRSEAARAAGDRCERCANRAGAGGPKRGAKSIQIESNCTIHNFALRVPTARDATRSSNCIFKTVSA